jgi:hypothetical protein
MLDAIRILPALQAHIVFVVAAVIVDTLALPCFCVTTACHRR